MKWKIKKDWELSIIFFSWGVIFVRLGMEIGLTEQLKGLFYVLFGIITMILTIELDSPILIIN